MSSEPEIKDNHYSGKCIPKSVMCQAYGLEQRGLNLRIKYVLKLNRYKFYTPKEVQLIIDEMGPPKWKIINRSLK